MDNLAVNKCFAVSQGMTSETGHPSLTLSLPITTKVTYANSVDPDATPSSSASHPDPSCLALGQNIQKL